MQWMKSNLVSYFYTYVGSTPVLPVRGLAAGSWAG